MNNRKPIFGKPPNGMPAAPQVNPADIMKHMTPENALRCRNVLEYQDPEGKTYDELCGCDEVLVVRKLFRISSLALGTPADVVSHQEIMRCRQCGAYFNEQNFMRDKDADAQAAQAPQEDS